MLPVHGALQLVAFDDDQVIVEEFPKLTDAGVAETETDGAVALFTITVALADPLPPALEQSRV